MEKTSLLSAMKQPEANVSGKSFLSWMLKVSLAHAHVLASEGLQVGGTSERVLH